MTDYDTVVIHRSGWIEGLDCHKAVHSSYIIRVVLGWIEGLDCHIPQCHQHQELLAHSAPSQQYQKQVDSSLKIKF